MKKKKKKKKYQQLVQKSISTKKKNQRNACSHGLGTFNPVSFVSLTSLDWKLEMADKAVLAQSTDHTNLAIVFL